MVVYIEACESGSMLEGLLPNNINIYATTASNAEESSYACYYDSKRETYLGDLYSVNWMEDSDAEDITKESLFKQFQVTKKKTTESHVMQYGDLVCIGIKYFLRKKFLFYNIQKLGAAHNVSEFQGENESNKNRTVNPLIDRVNALLKVRREKLKE